MNTAAATTLPTMTGVIEQKQDERIVLDVLETDYHLHLVPLGEVRGEVGDRVTGTVRCEARRVDVFPAGGLFIEPVYGRPRRIHGRVIGGDVDANELWVKAGPGAPIIVKLMPSQRAADFYLGQIVGFDARAGATFEQTPE